MKKLKIFLTFVVVTILLVTEILTGESSTTTVSELINKTTEQLLLEEYTPKVIIQASFGNKPGEFGIKKFHEGVRGPTSMGVDYYGNIFILDPVNQRIQKFNKNGTFIDAIAYSSDLSKDFDFFSEVVQMTIDKKGNIYLSDLENILVLDQKGNVLYNVSAKDLSCEYINSLYDIEKDQYVIFTKSGQGLIINNNGNSKFYQGKIKPFDKNIMVQKINKYTSLLNLEKDFLVVKLERKLIDMEFLIDITNVKKDVEGNIYVFIIARPQRTEYLKDIADWGLYKSKWKWFLYKYDKNKKLISIIDRESGFQLLYSKYAWEYIDDFGNYYKLAWNDERPEEGVRVIKWIKKK